MLTVQFFQTLTRHMRVNLRGRNIRMPQQHLHYAQVGAVIDEVRGERMPQSVRRQRFVDARTARIVAAITVTVSVIAIVTGWSAFACAPFGKELQRVIDIEAQVVRDIDTLIAGECARRGEKLLPASKARAASA